MPDGPVRIGDPCPCRPADACFGAACRLVEALLAMRAVHWLLGARVHVGYYRA